MRSKADETLVIVETLICPLQIALNSFCIFLLQFSAVSFLAFCSDRTSQ